MTDTKVKVSDLIPNYKDSATSGDIVEWLKKLELQMRLQKIKDLAGLLPLFLSGPAIAVYGQLEEEVQADFGRLREELLLEFGTNSFQAYDSLSSQKYRSGETVDVYAADFQRLVSFIGQWQPELLSKCAFVQGLPPEGGAQLKSIAAGDKLSLAELAIR